MTILYVITDLEVGGVPLHLQRLAPAMRARGFHPVVVSLYPPGPVGRSLREAGIEVRSCDGRGGFDVRVIPRLAAILRRCKPRMVHAFLFHANLAARLAGKWAKFPRDRIFCEIQTVEVQRRWHLVADHFTHDLCRLTIGNAPSVVRHLAACACLPPHRLRLVRGGIDPKRCTAPRTPNAALLPAAGLPQNARTILWVGRLDVVKGLDVLLKALERLRQRVDAHLLLAGEGAYRVPLERLAATLRLTDQVHFLGVRSDVTALLRSTEVFAFPSRTEGLPNALLEAMACGCSIVTTDVPGCRDLITHERTGLLVPFDDPDLLSQALLRLFTDAALRTRLGTNAQHEVATRWRFDQTLESYETLYREAMA
ncbi:MAG: glycosyltransferase [Phycisphaerae bacterium]